MADFGSVRDFGPTGAERPLLFLGRQKADSPLSAHCGHSIPCPGASRSLQDVNDGQLESLPERQAYILNDVRGSGVLVRPTS